MRTDDLIATARDHGHDALGVLGTGMEGTALGLADGTVLKVWTTRTEPELRRLQAFHDAVAAAGLPFATARVLDVLRVGDRAATRQLRLDGTPLWQRPGVSPDPDGCHPYAAVVEVLVALADVPATDDLALLPVLPDEPPFDPGARFERSLADLVERRAAGSATVLGARIPGLDDLVVAVTGRLRDLEPARPALLHGDLVPGNLLVVDDAVSGLLDFGFLSTVGDPAFDAAVASSVFDMYGPHARAWEARLEDALVHELGHDPARLGSYRAAYALVTATCFSASGSDGHFDWCVRMLERPDVRQSLV